MDKRYRRVLHFIFLIVVIVILMERCDGPLLPTKPKITPNNPQKTGEAKKAKKLTVRKKPLDTPQLPKEIALPEFEKQVVTVPTTVIVRGAGADELYTVINESDHDRILIDWTGLKERLSKIASKEVIQSLDEQKTEDKEQEIHWIEVSKLKSQGFVTQYDENKQEIVISIPIDARDKKSINIMRQNLNYDGPVIKPDPISGFVNFFLGKNFAGKQLNNTPQDDNFAVNVDGALNVYGWVIETTGNFKEGTPYRRDFLRVVKDDEKNAIRYKFGDVLAPKGGFLKGDSLGGVSFDRNNSITPNRILYPINEHEIQLKTSALLEVLINNRSVFSNRLDAGTYDIRDFPFYTGINDVTLVVKDINTGKIIEKYSLASFSYSTNLLRKGNHEFHYSAGSRRTSELDKNSVKVLGQNYSNEDFVFSFAHRYGLLDRLTVSLFSQLYSNHSLFGTGATISTPFGLLTVEGAYSDNKLLGISGYGSKFEYLYNFKQINFRAGYEKRTDGFTLADSSALLNYAYYGSAGFYVTNRTNIFLLANKSHLYDNTEKFLSSIGVTTRVNSDLSISGQGIYEQFPDKSPETTIKLNLNWNFGSSPNSGSVIARTDSRLQTEEVTASYNKGLENSRTLGFSGGLQRAPGQNDYHAGARLTAPQGFVSATSTATQTEFDIGHSANISAGTGIAFVGSTFSWTGIVQDSFAIVKGYNALEDENILINPNKDFTRSDAETNIFGSATTRLVSYRPNRVIIAIEDQKPNVTLKQDNFVLSPSYKSGTLIKLDADKTVTIKGYLLGSDKNPLYEVSGELTIDDSSYKDEPVFFYTNPKGYFVIEGLREATYTLTFFDEESTAMKLTVPKSLDGEANLGNIYGPFTKKPKD